MRIGDGQSKRSIDALILAVTPVTIPFFRRSELALDPGVGRDTATAPTLTASKLAPKGSCCAGFYRSELRLRRQSTLLADPVFP